VDVSPIVVRIPGSPTPGDVTRLCAELSARLEETGATEAVCDVGALEHPDLTAVDTLARLRLTAQRQGCRLRLHGPRPELSALLRLLGLAVLLAEPGRAGPPGGPPVP
jgi:anti-anti-sigma regulatory factor